MGPLEEMKKSTPSSDAEAGRAKVSRSSAMVTGPAGLVWVRSFRR